MKKHRIIKSVFLVLSVGVLIGSLKLYNDLNPNTDFHQEDNLNWVSTSKGSIYIKTLTHEDLADSTNLVFVIHGDSPSNKPGYQYQMAQNIAKLNKRTISIGILRPGYTDPDNNTSNGIRGLTTGDNYTLAVIEAISETILKLKSIYQPVNTIVIGHSGGAAITGDIAGMKPGLINTAVLVSCPCDVSKWRSYMANRQFYNPAWRFNVTSISPMSVAATISNHTKVIIIVGEKDDITPMYLSEEYYQKLKTLDKKATFLSIPDQGHEILFNKSVMSKIEELLTTRSNPKQLC